MKKQINEIRRMQQLAGILKENNINEAPQPDWSSMGLTYSDTIGDDNEDEYNEIVNITKKLYQDFIEQYEKMPDQEKIEYKIPQDIDNDITNMLDAIYSFSFRKDNNITLSDGRIVSISSFMKKMLENGDYSKLAQDILEIIIGL